MYLFDASAQVRRLVAIALALLAGPSTRLCWTLSGEFADSWTLNSVPAFSCSSAIIRKALPVSLALEDEDEVLQCVLCCLSSAWFISSQSFREDPEVQRAGIAHEPARAARTNFQSLQLPFVPCHGPWPMAASRTVTGLAKSSLLVP